MKRYNTGYSNDRYVLVAVSGGPDSMALLDILYRCGLKVVACHVNYQRRPTAKRDENIVKTYCQKREIPFEVTYPIYQNNNNFQSWARDVRYDFFNDLKDKYATNILFVAHHLDDYIETLYMQLERKAYYDHYGIARISHHHDLLVLRPLLHYLKATLERYCQIRAIEYGIDESNLSLAYHRNEIRHEKLKDMSYMTKLRLFKKVEDINAQRDHYINTLRIKYQKDEYLVSEYDMIIDKDSFWRIKIDRKIAKEQLADLEDKMHNDNVFIIIKDRIIEKYRGRIYIKDTPKDYSYTYDGYMLDKKEYYSLCAEGDSFHCATLKEEDYPITIRNFNVHDKIKMLYGTKKVNRWFIDHKIPKYRRISWPIVINKNGEVIFVPGIGSDLAHYSIKPNFFMIEYGNMEDRENAC